MATRSSRCASRTTFLAAPGIGIFELEILARSAADGPGPPGEGALKHEREGRYRDRASQHSSALVERAFRLRSVQKSASCTEALTVPYVAAARVTVLGTPALLLHEFDV